MVLNPKPDYPVDRSYLLRLHRDATPSEGRLSGRIEHLSSGDGCDFTDGDQLLAWLQRHLADAPR